MTDVIYYRMTMFELTANWFDRTGPSRLLSMAPFYIYFFNYPVYFMQVVISINRLTGMWWPLKHKRVLNSIKINFNLFFFSAVLDSLVAPNCGIGIPCLNLPHSPSFAIQCHLPNCSLRFCISRIRLHNCNRQL